MTIEELKIEIEQIRDQARETLQEMHEQKMSQNSFGCGHESGTMWTCQQILDLINGVES